MSIIKINNLYKEYRNADIITPVLKGINISIEEGEFSALAGPSGSGKTTLLNIIGCLDKCTNGKIVIAAENVSDLSKKRMCEFRRNNLGFVFQSYNLIPVLSVFENVEYPLILKKVPKEERKEHVEYILEQVGLKDMLQRRPNQLSGGQQQRVSIARALVGKPKVVLADEPTANLDSKTGSQILELLKEMNENMKISFLFSTHDPRIMDFAKKIIYLEDGIIKKMETHEPTIQEKTTKPVRRRK